MLSAERTAPKTVSPALRGSRRLPVWPGPGCPPPRPRPFAECGTRPTRSRSVRAGSCLQLLRLSSPGARWTHLQKGLRLPGPGSPREPPPPDATRGANPGGGGPLPRPSALAHRLFMLMLFVALPDGFCFWPSPSLSVLLHPASLAVWATSRSHGKDQVGAVTRPVGLVSAMLSRAPETRAPVSGGGDGCDPGGSDGWTPVL